MKRREDHPQVSSECSFYNNRECNEKTRKGGFNILKPMSQLMRVKVIIRTLLSPEIVFTYSRRKFTFGNCIEQQPPNSFRFGLLISKSILNVLIVYSTFTVFICLQHFLHSDNLSSAGALLILPNSLPGACVLVESQIQFIPYCTIPSFVLRRSLCPAFRCCRTGI